MGWIFHLLVRHPEIYRKLRLVVLAEFGSYENAFEMTSPKLQGCQYLQKCLNETLRLYPPIPVNYRCATRDTTLPRGGGPDGTTKIFVRKNQQVDYSVYVLHRRKDIWGEDAEEFNPERWSRRRLNGLEYLPFNRGPRTCLGRELLALAMVVLDLHQTDSAVLL